VHAVLSHSYDSVRTTRHAYTAAEPVHAVLSHSYDSVHTTRHAFTVTTMQYFN